jgi:hypothetical protein
MPQPTLSVLAIIAFIFGCYSICCSLYLTKAWSRFLLAICIAKILYSILTASLAVYHYSQLTKLALIYFVSEIVIIGLLVLVEMNTIKSLSSNNGH